MQDYITIRWRMLLHDLVISHARTDCYLQLYLTSSKPDGGLPSLLCLPGEAQSVFATPVAALLQVTGNVSR